MDSLKAWWKTPATATPSKEVLQKDYPEYAKAAQGLTAIDRIHFAMMDNAAEGKAYLTKRFGPENVVERKDDKTGKTQLYVKQDGKEVKATAGFVDSLIGDAPELMGMAGMARVGAAAGGELGGPLGAIGGGLLGAGIGAMFGKGAKEAGKAAEGTLDKTPTEEAQAISTAAKSGIEGQAAGEVVGGAVSRVMKGGLPRWFSGVDDKTAQMVERTTTGTRPQTSQTLTGQETRDTLPANRAQPSTFGALPAMTHLQRGEALALRLAGPPTAQTEANAAYLKNRVTGMLKTQGYSPPQVEALAHDLEDPTATMSSRETGEQLKAGVQAHVETQQAALEALRTEATGTLDRQLADITKTHGTLPQGTDLAEATAGGIRQAKQAFQSAANSAYEHVYDLTGRGKVVPVDGISGVAGDIVRSLPNTTTPAVIREMSKLAGRKLSQEDAELMKAFNLSEAPEDGKISMKDAHRVRTVLRAKGKQIDLNRNVQQGDSMRVASAVNDAMHQAPPEAVRALDETDEWYAKNAGKFRTAEVNAFIKSVRGGMPPNPSKVVSMIVRPGNDAYISTVKGMVKEDSWKQVAAEDWNQALAASRTPDGKVDGDKLFAEVAKRGSTLPLVHGEGMAKDMREVAKGLLVRDGKIDPALLAPSRLKDTLTEMREQDKALNSFMSENYLAALAKPDVAPEGAFRWIVQPGQETRLAQAFKFFGKDSPQVKAIQSEAFKQLFYRAIGDSRKAPLIDELAKYTRTQQQMLFPNGAVDDIKLFADEQKFLFPSERELSTAGMRAGTLQDKPLLERLYYVALYGMYRSIIRSPNTIRWLAIGLRDPGPVREGTKAAIKTLITNQMLQAEGQEQ